MTDKGYLMLGGSPSYAVSPVTFSEAGKLLEVLERPVSLIEHPGEALATADGSLWTRRQIGPDRHETRRWRAGKWTSWIEPEEVTDYRMLAVDSYDRIWLHRSMDQPAALLDTVEASPSYRVDSLRALLASEAVAGREFTLRATYASQSDGTRPVVWRGSVLAWTRYGRVEYWQAGRWIVLPDAPGDGPREIGFDSAGMPRVGMYNQKPRVLNAAGVWVEADEVDGMVYGWRTRDDPVHTSGMGPDWFRREVEMRGDGHRYPWLDADGDWWGISKSGLLRGRDGRAWLAIRPEVSDPWRVGHAGGGRVVHMPDGGLQVWCGDSVTLVPAAALAERPGDGD